MTNSSNSVGLFNSKPRGSPTHLGPAGPPIFFCAKPKSNEAPGASALSGGGPRGVGRQAHATSPPGGADMDRLGSMPVDVSLQVDSDRM